MLNSGVYSFTMLVVGCVGLCLGSVVFLNEFIADPIALVQGTELVSGSALAVSAVIIAMSFLSMAFAALIFTIARTKHRRHLRHMR